MKKSEEYNSNIIDEILNSIPKEEAEKIENRMLLAAKIDDARLSKKWSKTEFAQRMNKRPSEITKWLSGTHNFTSDTLFEIESKLGVKLIDIVAKKEEEILNVEFNVVCSVEKPSFFSLIDQVLFSEESKNTVTIPNFLLPQFKQNKNLNFA